MSNWIQSITSLFKPATPDPMKFLVVGLGNIGPEYDQTRHNIGFEVLDQWVKQHDAQWDSGRLASIADRKSVV